MGISTVVTGAASVALSSQLLGGKAANLVQLLEAGLRVPEWIVLPTTVLEQQLADWALKDWLEQDSASLTETTADIPAICTRIREALVSRNLSETLVGSIKEALDQSGMGDDCFLAVRSSVVGEDALHDSFAGQMDSFLFLKGIDAIAAAVIRCWASAWSERAIRYRLQKGLPITGIRSGVIIQRMIDGEVSGVLFTAHPVTGSRKEALLTAAYGLGEGLVSGRCNADEFTVSLDPPGILQQTISHKDMAVVSDTDTSSGTRETEITGARADAPCLTDALILQIVAEGYRLAQQLAAPQDIEWTLSGDRLWYLQTRPITTLPHASAPSGKRIVWNNANIQESYFGVTTPLTYSFARMAYARVYTDTMRIMGIPEKTIAAHADILQNLLGLLRGRIYYNINNWYRGLLLLPSFRTNKADMESMMGLQEPVDFITDRELSAGEKIRKLPGLILTFSRLLLKFRNIETLVGRFGTHFNREYDRIDRSTLHTLQLPELIAVIRQLENDMLGHWQTPIINDFYVMMYNGRLKRRLERSGLQNPAALQNNLLSGEPGMESTAPTLELMRLAGLVRADDRLRQIFDQTPNDRLLPTLHLKAPAYYRQCRDYLDRYGDRCMGELKLESVSLRQDPSFMFAVIRNYILLDHLSPESLANREQGLRASAEQTVFTVIRRQSGGWGLHRFKRTLHRFRQGVRQRENMRLARTRMFGLFRDVYLEAGRQLALQGQLTEARDIFYLTVEELKAYAEGTCVNSDLIAITAARKAEFAAYEGEAPPHHFETTGIVYPVTVRLEQAALPATGGEVLKGLGCYPGLVQSRIRLIFSPDDELSVNNQILCTVRTDPGWAPLFPTCSGIIVERGSTLSHSAVVARELGIPAIVGVPGVTAWLKTGDEVRMDGSTGEIIRLNQSQNG